MGSVCPRPCPSGAAVCDNYFKFCATNNTELNISESKAVNRTSRTGFHSAAFCSIFVNCCYIVQFFALILLLMMCI